MISTTCNKHTNKLIINKTESYSFPSNNKLRKSTSETERWQFCKCIDPLKHIIADLNSETPNVHFNQLITLLYDY